MGMPAKVQFARSAAVVRGLSRKQTAELENDKVSVQLMRESTRANEVFRSNSLQITLTQTASFHPRTRTNADTTH